MSILLLLLLEAIFKPRIIFNPARAEGQSLLLIVNRNRRSITQCIIQFSNFRSPLLLVVNISRRQNLGKFFPIPTLKNDPTSVLLQVNLLAINFNSTMRQHPISIAYTPKSNEGVLLLLASHLFHPDHRDRS